MSRNIPKAIQSHDCTCQDSSMFKNSKSFESLSCLQLSKEKLKKGSTSFNVIRVLGAHFEWQMNKA